MTQRPRSDRRCQFGATADTECGFAGSLTASLTEVNTTRNEFGQHVVGIVTNDEELTGPVSVSVACFDQAGTQVLGTHTGFADCDPSTAGRTSSFTVDLFDGQCPNHAVGAGGCSFD